MPNSVVNMRVLKPGERTDRLLANVAKHLGKERLTPQDGQLPIFFSDATAGEAWDAVERVLNESDPEWRELVTIERRRES
jgi:hypothetical protein